MPMNTFLGFVLLFGNLHAVTEAQAPADQPIQGLPVKVGEGPLLFFTQTEEIRRRRDFDVYVFNPLQGQKPQLAFRSSNYIGPNVRIDADRLVIFCDNRTWLADLTKGTVRAIFADRITFFRGLEGSKLYFEEDPRHPKDRQDWAKQTDPDWHRLYVLDVLGEQKPTLLWDKRYSYLLHGLGGPFHHTETGWFSTKEHFWVFVTKPPAIWKIAKNGKDHQKVISLEKFPTLHFSGQSALSPKGHHLALAAWSGSREDLFSRGHLLVFDVRTGSHVCTFADIPVEVIRSSSSGPQLTFCWLDDHCLRYSETKLTRPGEKDGLHDGHFQWVDVDFRTKKRLQEKPYTNFLGLNHTMPSKDSLKPPDPRGRHREGMFDLVDENLYYHDAKEPIRPLFGKGEILNVREPRVSPDGRWAAFYDLRHDCIYLVDGEKKELKKIMDGFGFQLSWLPAVKR